MKPNGLIGGLTAIALALAALPAHATPSTSYYIYDESGHVIAEYDSTGKVIQDHIWLGGRPVAVVQGGNLDPVIADQQDTPQVITDANQNVMWSWAGDPFGNGQATSSLANAYNLRMPGQYYDAETGMNYNYFRDYDPATGRYIESDPFGLSGGINTYAYSLNNPLSIVDPFGLCPNCTDASNFNHGDDPTADSIHDNLQNIENDFHNAQRCNISNLVANNIYNYLYGSSSTNYSNNAWNNFQNNAPAGSFVANGNTAGLVEAGAGTVDAAITLAPGYNPSNLQKATLPYNAVNSEFNWYYIGNDYGNLAYSFATASSAAPVPRPGSQPCANP